MKDLFERVEKWAVGKGIDKPENRLPQMMKVYEEAGELAAGIARNDEEAIKDALGDVAVTVIISLLQNGIKASEYTERLFYGVFKENLCDQSLAISLFYHISCFGEVIRKNDRKADMMAFADMAVCYLSTLSHNQGYQLSEALEMVLDTIEKRKGKTVNGVFIKEGE